MAERGEQFPMPDGSIYIVHRPTAESDGAFVEMDFVLPHRCVPPPPHVHPHQVEDYEVLEGHFEVVIDGRWRSVAAGDRASVPLGAQHTFRNHSGQTVRVRNRHTPAMRFEEFIEQTCRTLKSARVRRKRDPRVAVYLSTVMLDYHDTLYPGRARERIPMRALAVIGRMLRSPDP